MAVEGDYSWLDVNGLGASNRIWANNAAGASTLAGLLKKLSNAKLRAAGYRTPIDISAIDPNAAAAANVETARTKMVITLSAPPLAGGAASAASRARTSSCCS